MKLNIPRVPKNKPKKEGLCLSEPYLIRYRNILRIAIYFNKKTIGYVNLAHNGKREMIIRKIGKFFLPKEDWEFVIFEKLVSYNIIHD